MSSGIKPCFFIILSLSILPATIPTIFPNLLIIGPPLLPGLILAVIWNSSIFPSKPTGLLIIPSVIDGWKLPIKDDIGYPNTKIFEPGSLR